MSERQQLIARNVRRYRQEKGLSMSALAQRAGIAKQTLATLESGRGNPTVETLFLLADALDLTARRLLTEWGTPVYVQRQDEGRWVTTRTGSERMLGEVYGSGYVRATLVRLRRRGQDRLVDAHDPGALHHVFVISGRILAGPAAEQVELEAGDFVRFPGDVPHVLHAVSDHAEVHVVTTEPQVGQLRE